VRRGVKVSAPASAVAGRVARITATVAPAGGVGVSGVVNFVGTANQFQIVPSTVPVWLTVSPLNGLAISGCPIHRAIARA